MEPLSFSNFFTEFYILHPDGDKALEKLTETEQKVALALSIILGVCTLGLVHAGFAIAERWCIKPKDEDDEEKKLGEIARNKMFKGDSKTVEQLGDINSESTDPEGTNKGEQKTEFLSRQPTQYVPGYDLNEKPSHDPLTILDPTSTPAQALTPAPLPAPTPKRPQPEPAPSPTSTPSPTPSPVLPPTPAPTSRRGQTIAPTTSRRAQATAPSPISASTLSPAPTSRRARVTASASIWIETTESALIGDPSPKRHLPTYLENRGDDAPVLTFENGDPIPLDSQDFLVPCTLFDASKSLGKLDLLSPLWLPSVLFGKEAKEGSVLKLRYGKEVIQLVIKQEGHHSLYQHDSIRDALASCHTHAETRWGIDGTTAFSSERHPFYRLGEKGTFYGLSKSFDEQGGLQLELKKKELSEWRPLDVPDEIKPGGGTFRLESGEIVGISIQAVLAGFSPEHIDVVLNETHLIFYARYQDGPRFDLSEARTQGGNDEFWRKLANGDKESICQFNWKHCEPLQNFTLEEMQARFLKGELSISHHGILDLVIPTII